MRHIFFPHPNGQHYLKDLEAVLDVLRVDLRDEEEVAHLPRVQRRLRAALRPIAKGEERRQEPPEGVQLLEEGVLLGVVGSVVHKVADHVGMAPVVQSNYALKAME